MACLGKSEDHCCYFKTGVCSFLEERQGTDRRWNCTLREKCNSWEEVYLLPEWEIVSFRALVSGLGESYRCGSWPPLGNTCATCGEIGNG